MRIRLLGTAAGGGVPQWNCNCPICREARSGTGRVQPRTQSSVAISVDDRRWFLLNASPDIHAQIEAFKPLRPHSLAVRGSPIQSVLLTNADLDHTLGLFLLREGEELLVHATESVRDSLTEGISLTSTMTAFCGIQWVNPPSELSPLLNRDGSESGILYQTLSVGGRQPRFSRTTSQAMDPVVGYRFIDQKSQGRLLFLPDVAVMDGKINDLLTECDVLLFDGTFWSEDEMKQRGAGTLAALEMGHVPISGAGGSLRILKQLDVKHRIYVHINNTNPILLEDSAERAAVLATGCIVGNDGMEFHI